MSRFNKGIEMGQFEALPSGEINSPDLDSEHSTQFTHLDGSGMGLNDKQLAYQQHIAEEIQNLP
jgi:hypothetical protein